MTPPANAVPPPAPEAPVSPTDAEIVAEFDKGKPTEAEKPTEGTPAPVEAPRPETPKESALLRSIAKRERELVAERQQLSARTQQQEATIEARIQAGVERALKERFADPRAAVKALGALGMKDQDIADGLLHKDAATPDEMARRALEESAALKKQLADRDARETKTRLETEYLSTAKRMGDAGELKHARLEWTEPEMVQETYRIIAELGEECRIKGIPVPQVQDERFLRLLDKRAKLRQDARKAREAGGATPGSEANGGGHQGGQTGAAATSTTTLGKGLGERTSVSPPDPLTMSRDEVISEALKKVSAGFIVKPR